MPLLSIKKLPETLFLMIVLILGGFYLFHDSMSLPPAYVHAWTQSDRLAIAMKFQENGFDFFHPATYNLLTKEGITQVDFPIHDYLVSLISSLSGSDLSATFRFYNLACFLIGLLFFFKTLRQLNSPALLSILSTIFISTLPFLAYYQNGFLPSIPAYACFCIGLYFFSKHLSQADRRAFFLGIFFFTLAALARIPFSIPLIALVALEVITVFQRKRLQIAFLLAPLIGLFAVIAYYFYNQYLAETYGSMFLAEFRFVDDLKGLWSVILQAAERWQGQLLSPFHWAWVIILFVALYFSKGLRKKGPGVDRLAIFTMITAIGSISYFLLMSLQFVDHDYYYIDAFLPLLNLVFLISLRSTSVGHQWYTPLAAFGLIMSLSMYAYARSNQDARYELSSTARLHYNFEIYQQSAEDLKNWGIGPKDTLAVFDASSTNLPFIVWGNQGYTSLSSGESSANALLEKPFDYAVMVDSFKISDSYFDYPEIAHQLKLVNTNGKISIFKKSASKEMDQFFKKLYAQHLEAFEDSLDDKQFQFQTNATQTILDDMKGKSLRMDANSDFPFTMSYSAKEPIDSRISVSLQFDYYPVDSTKGMQLVLAVGDFYKGYFLENEIEEDHFWNELQFHEKIPPRYLNTPSALKIYFWNPERQTAYLDNFEILIYE